MSGEGWVPLDERISDALASVSLGTPVSQHFITLPSGMTIAIKPGEDAWQAFTRHALPALSEGMCPWCNGRLNERRECIGFPPQRSSVHRPCRWHMCGQGWGQVFLDVPRHADGTLGSNPCFECGQEM